MLNVTLFQLLELYNLQTLRNKMDDANEFAERGKLDIRDHDEIGRKVLGNI